MGYLSLRSLLGIGIQFLNAVFCMRMISLRFRLTQRAAFGFGGDVSGAIDNWAHKTQFPILEEVISSCMAPAIALLDYGKERLFVHGITLL
jgi:hypothetical protein